MSPFGSMSDQHSVSVSNAHTTKAKKRQLEELHGMNQDNAITYTSDMGLNQKFCRFQGLFSLQRGVLFFPKKPSQS